MKQSTPTYQPKELDAKIASIEALSIGPLRAEWQMLVGSKPPQAFTKDLLARALTYRLEEAALGGLSAHALQALRDHAKPTKPPRQVKTGSIIVREYLGVLHEVLVVPEGFCWQGKTFGNLSIIAKEITSTNWNGPRFFGLRKKRETAASSAEGDARQTHTGASRKVLGGRRSSIRSIPARNAVGYTPDLRARPAP